MIPGLHPPQACSSTSPPTKSVSGYSQISSGAQNLLQERSPVRETTEILVARAHGGGEDSQGTTVYVTHQF